MKTAVGPGYACVNGKGRKPNNRARFHIEEIIRLSGAAS
jgi:hypothetical protein